MPPFKDRKAKEAEKQVLTDAAMQMPGMQSQHMFSSQPFLQAQAPASSGVAPFPEQIQTAAGIGTDPLLHTNAFFATSRTGDLSDSAAVLATQQLPEYALITRQLPELQTGALLPTAYPDTSTQRQPVVIRGNGRARKSVRDLQKPLIRRRRWTVHIAVLVLVALVVTVTLMSVLPESADGSSGFNPLRSVMNMVHNNDGSNFAGLNLVAQRAATATAITTNHSGYDPGPTTQQPVVGSRTGDPFPWGQCTYWADLRYHQLVGDWVSWGGNAGTWAAGARANGWHVSTVPHIPSIVVLQPGVQGAGWVGHVAVAEKMTSDGGVSTSNMNFYANGGGLGIVSYYTFYPTGNSSVLFVWI